MTSAERAQMIRERFRSRSPFNRPAAKAYEPPPPAPRSVVYRRPESPSNLAVYLPYKDGPRNLVVWVQTPDPEPPIFRVRLPQSALVALTWLWFEEWRLREARRKAGEQATITAAGCISAAESAEREASATDKEPAESAGDD